MTDYRGVDKQDVISSLKAGEAFLRSLNLGPATEEMLDAWLAKDPYSTLEAAETHEDLANAMAETGSGHVWARAGGVFHTHALADSDGVALKAYQDLSRWGAFAGAITMDYQPTDNEFQRDTILTYAAYALAQNGSFLSLAAQDSIDASIEKKKAATVAFWKDHAGNDEIIKQELNRCEEKRQRMHEILVNLPQDLAALSKAYEEMELDARYAVEETLLAASGLGGKKVALPEGPFERYGIFMDPLPSGFDAMRNDPTLQKINQVLEPFWALGEVRQTGIGQIVESKKEWGMMFVGTKAAAQAVADAMPERQLVNAKGAIIPPSSAAKPATPKKSNGPKL